jgi:acetylornithine deacetylase/succinyl-diaminopimelate desuccinylase-like protein
MEASQNDQLNNLLEKYIREKALPALMKFIEIPNLSSAFDPEWATNGLLEKACEFCIDFAKEMDIKGLKVDMYQEEGKTPLVFGIAEPTRQGKYKNLVMYGHIDKQPHLTEGWSEGLHPTTPIIKDGLLYGRGGVDDGYNFFTIICMLKALQDLDIAYDRMVLFYETDEESNSDDIPFWMKKFEKEIGIPEIMFCLDAGTVSNKIFSLSTTLRGCVNFDLTVRVLEQGAHSGLSSGIVPSSFRIIRQLLDRIECSKSGKIYDELQVLIPDDKLAQAREVVKVLGDDIHKNFCMCKGVKPVSDDIEELYLNNLWRSQLEIIGQEGIPDKNVSGNVLRPFTTLRCSLRIPPTITGEAAFDQVKETLTKDAPYGAHIEVTRVGTGTGWNCNEIPNKVIEILDKHNQAIFGTKTLLFGCGGSIPFVKVIQDCLPETLLFVTGLMLPTSNIHAPDENIDIEYWIKFTKSLTGFLVDFANVQA